MKPNSIIYEYDNPLKGILEQYDQDDTLLYASLVWKQWNTGYKHAKSEELPYVIEKMLTGKANTLHKMCACMFLFEYAPYTSKETAKNLFERISYKDPCGKYDITAIKRLCVNILEEIVSEANTFSYRDLAIICLRRMYDVEYADKIFDGYLTDEELKARRSKYKVCFVIVPEEGYDLLMLRRLRDIAIMGIFEKRIPAVFSLFKKKSREEKITVCTKPEWNSLYERSPITLEIDREEIRSRMLTTCEEEQELVRRFCMEREFLSIQNMGDMEIKEIVDTYFQFVTPDFCVEVNI